MHRFLTGATSYLTGLQLIARHRLWLYVWIPILISLILGYFILRGAYGISDDLGGWIVSFYPFEFGKATFEKIATITGGISLVAFTLLIFRYIIMAVASPFMSLLSERLEQKLYPERPRPAFSLGKMFSDLIRGIRIALRNIIREIVITIFILIMGIIIPILSPAVPILILVVQSYYAGFGNFDFTLERHMGVRESVRFTRANRMLAIGNGAVFILLLMTVVGFLFALPLGTAAGAVVTLDELDKRE